MDLTENDEDDNSLTSDITLQLPASASSISDIPAVVAISETAGDRELNQRQYPSVQIRGQPSCGPREPVQLVTQRAPKAFKMNVSLPHSKMKQSRGKILSMLGQEKLFTIATCNYKSVISSKKHMPPFSQRGNGTVISFTPESKLRCGKSARQFGNKGYL